MKKLYTQPDILFESFALNQNIATGNQVCTRNNSSQYSGNCGMHHGNQILFTIPVSGCHTKIESGMYDGICYHVPTGEMVLFNS